MLLGTATHNLERMFRTVVDVVVVRKHSRTSLMTFRAMYRESNIACAFSRRATTQGRMVYAVVRAYNKPDKCAVCVDGMVVPLGGGGLCRCALLNK